MAGVELRVEEDGRIWCLPYLGTDRVTGRAIRPYRSWPAGTPLEAAQREADEWAAGFAPAAASGAGKRLGSMLVRWVTDPARGYSGNTVATCLSAIRCYIEPTLGDIPYDGLGAHEVRAAYRELLTDRPGRPAISRRTLTKAHALLRAAYRDWAGQIGRDPMLDVPPPEVEPAEPFALDECDQGGLSAALRSAMGTGGTDRGTVERRTTAFAVYLALNQALRCGEACAALRRDVRAATGDLHVGATVVERPRLMRRPYPKRGSVGNVAMAPEVLAEVRRHEAWQDRWLRSPGPRTPLVTYNADGALVRPSDLSRRFKALVRELGLPAETVFHTLRHMHATWLLMHGCDMRTVQERLRHRDVATTLRIYGSVMPGRDARAAAAFSSSLTDSSKDL